MIGLGSDKNTWKPLGELPSRHELTKRGSAPADAHPEASTIFLSPPPTQPTTTHSSSYIKVSTTAFQHPHQHLYFVKTNLTFVTSGSSCLGSGSRLFVRSNDRNCLQSNIVKEMPEKNQNELLVMRICLSPKSSLGWPLISLVLTFPKTSTVTGHFSVIMDSGSHPA